jgi:DNA-binding NarL/FixJ family response regulator
VASDLAEAEAAAGAALAIGNEWGASARFTGHAAAFLADALMEQGKLDDAAAALARAEQGEALAGKLEEAVQVLEGCPAKLEHAKARTELGAALRRANRRSEAREHLRKALELATICGAAALAERAETELLATGARPRRIALSGIQSLTPSERRVAEMAAKGPTNREIAQALFVTH